MTVGIIVAGGASSRFGDANKALATVGGTPMIRRVADSLAPVVDRIVVNARDAHRAQYATALSDVDRPIRFAIDRQPDCGPVIGLEAALDAVSARMILVLACDLPLVRPTTLSQLLDELGVGGVRPNGSATPDCVLPRVEGHPRPLCGAYYRKRFETAIDRLDDARHASLRDVLDRLRVSTVPGDRLPGGSSAFENVNTRDDLRTARKIARERRTDAPISLY